MKNLLQAFCILTCFGFGFGFAACSAGSKVREQLIVDYVRSNFSGIKPEYIVTIPELESKGVITVADSLVVITETFEADRASKVRQSEILLETLRSLADLQSSNSFVSQTEKEASQAGIRQQEAVLDSLRTLEMPSDYAGRSGSEVLALIVRGRISVSETSGGRTLEDTYDFYTSPDGRTVYNHIKAK